jgi:hypothetical protein
MNLTAPLTAIAAVVRSLFGVTQVVPETQNVQISPKIDEVAVNTFEQPKSTYQMGLALENFVLALKANNCSDSTIRNYRSDINQFALFSGVQSISESLTKPKLLAFQSYQLEKGLRGSSIKRKFSSLTQFALWAQKQELLPSRLDWVDELVKTGELKGEVNVQSAPSAINSSPSILPGLGQPVGNPLPPQVPATAVLTSVVAPAAALEEQAEVIKQFASPASSAARTTLKKSWLNKIPVSFWAGFNVAVLVLFMTGLGVLAYRQWFIDAPASLAYPSTPTRPNRVLSFQGRLTDTAQNPVTTATDMVFKLYDSGPSIVGGTELWTSGTCSITGDQDGIFSTTLGSSCGTEIDDSVFSVNQNVWLEVTVEGETLSPRQPIAAVGYALNAETLQGYPITASGAATVSTVVTMNEVGDIVLGEVSPMIKSVSGTLTLEGQSILLQTTSGSNGNIIFDADGTGGVQSRDYISAPGATLSATYAGGVPLTAKGGPSGTGNLTDWRSAANALLAYVTSAGNIVSNATFGIASDEDLLSLATNALTVNGSITSTSDITLNSQSDLRLADSDSSNYIALQAPATVGSNLTYTLPSSVTDGYILSTDGSGVLSWVPLSGGSRWTITSGAIHPNNSTLDLLVGGTASSSAKFAVLNVNSGTPTASVSAGTTGAAYLTATGSLQTTAMQTLTLGGNTTGDILLQANGDTNDYLSLTSDGTHLTLAGVGTPNLTLAPGGTLFFHGSSNSLTTGGLLTLAGSIDVNGTSNDIAGTLNLSGNTLTSSGDLAITPTGGDVTITGTLAVSGNINSSGGDLQTNGTTRISNGGNLTNIGTTQFNGVTYTWPGADGSSGQVLSTDSSGNLSWTGAATDSSIHWLLANGTIYPKNSTVDLLVGGTSTASAKFAFYNVDSGTPTASISAGTTGGVYLTADGTLATTAMQTLTLGNSTTGNIDIGDAATTKTIHIGGVDSSGTDTIFIGTNSTAGDTILIGNTNSSSSVAINGGDSWSMSGSGVLNLNTASSQITAIVATDTGYTNALSVGDNDIIGTTFDITGTTGNLDFTNFDVVGSSGNITTAGDLAVNGDDITSDGTLTIDAVTDIQLDADNGWIYFKDGGTTFATFNNESTDMTLNVAGGNFLLANGDVLNVGGASAAPYNFFAGSTVGVTNVDGDNDLYIEDKLEVDGVTTFGDIVYNWPTTQNTNYILQNNGSGVLSWVDPAVVAASTNYWTDADGVLYPKNSTYDFAIGGTSSASAKFAVLNIDSGTPTASLSAGTSGGAYLTASGTLSTTAMQTLTLGTSTTGNIDLGDAATTKTIHIGGVTSSGTDTISIGTNGTAADTITIGNTNASTTLALTGGDDWSITSGGVLTMSASASQTTAVVITDTDYTNALSIGDNNIIGTTAAIDLTNFDVATTGNITVAAGVGLDTNAAGALALGNVNATSVSICNSNACDAITIGSTADADTITIGDAASDTTTLNGSTVAIDSADWDITTVGNMSGIGTIASDGDWTMTQTTPSILLVDSTASEDDYSVNVDANAFTIINSTDSRTELSFAGDGGIDFGDNTATKTIDIGGVTASAADTINISTNGTAADVITVGNTNASTTLALTGGDDWSLSATGILTLSASAAQTTALVITDTDYTNALSIGDNNIIGTTANIDLTNFDVVGSTGAVTTIGNVTINAQSDLRLGDADSSNYIALQAPATVGSNLTYTLPATVTDGYVMRTDGSGTLSWADPKTLGLWQLNAGALSPFSLTADVNLGATATASAKVSLAGSLDRDAAVAIFNQTESNEDIITGKYLGSTVFEVTQTGDVQAGKFSDIANTAYFLQPAASSHALAILGAAGIGESGTPDAKLEVFDDTAAQLRLTNTEDVDYANFTVDSSGILEIAPSGGEVWISGALEVFGDVMLGEEGANAVVSNAALWSFTSQTTVSLSNIADSFNFDSNTLSIDALNNRVGIGSSAPDKALEINSATGANLRLTYNDSNGSATNYADFSMSAVGDLTIAPSGNDVTWSLTGMTFSNDTVMTFSGGDNALDMNFTADTTTGSQEGMEIYYLSSNSFSTSTTFYGTSIDTNLSGTLSGTGTTFTTYGLDSEIFTQYSLESITAAQTLSTFGVRGHNTWGGSVNHTSDTVSLYGVYGHVEGDMGTVGATSKTAVIGNAFGTADINYGVYANASGATTNYGVYSAAGTNYFAGSVGIGTDTTPNRLLHLSQDNAAIQIDDPGGGSWILTNSVANDGGIGFYDGTAFRLYMESGGQIGIGTTTPSSLLHIASTSPATMTIETTTDGESSLLFDNGSGRDNWKIGADMTVGNTFEIRNMTDGVTRMVVDPDGDVGIGTTTPSTRLHVVATGGSTAGQSYASSLATLTNTNSFSANTNNLGFNSDVTVSGTMSGNGTVFETFGSYSQGNINYTANAGDGLTQNLNGYGARGLGVWGGSATSGLDYVTIVGVQGFATGNIGTNSISAHQGINGTSTGTADVNYGVYGYAESATTNYAVYANGNLAYTGSLINASDARMKENITDLSSSLDKVLALRGVSYNLIGTDASQSEYGFIAQEVQTILPDAVHLAVPEKGYLGLNYISFIPLLTEAIQEQQLQIENLQAGQTELAITDEGLLNLSYDAATQTATVTHDSSTVTKITAAATSVIGKLRAGLVTTQELIANLRVRSPQVQTDLISPLSGNDVAIQLGDNSNPANPAELQIKNATNQTVATIDSQGNTSLLGELTATGLEVNGDATVSGEVTATSARLQQLEAQMAELETVRAQTAELVNATVSGTLYAENIAGFDAKVATALEQPSLLQQLMGEDPSAELASTSATLASLFQVVDQTGYSASGSAALNKDLADLGMTTDDVVLGASALFVNNYFEVNGTAYVANSLGIGQHLLVGEGMHIADGVIEYNPAGNTAPVLNIQPQGKGTINFLAGAMIISENGDLEITGDLKVAGDVTVEDSLLTDLLQPTSFDNPFQIKVAGVATESGEVKQSRLEITNELDAPVATVSATGRAEFAGGIAVESENIAADGTNPVTATKTSGRATIVAGTTELVINSEQITADSLIYVTPLGSTNNQVLYVKAQTAEDQTTSLIKEGQFVVGFDAALGGDVQFNWWIVN